MKTIDLLKRTARHISDCAIVAHDTPEHHHLIKKYREELEGLRTAAIIARVHAKGKKAQEVFTDFIKYLSALDNQLFDLQIKPKEVKA